MTVRPSTRPVLVGIVPGQPEAVLRVAAEYAVAFGAELVVAWVDATRYTAGLWADGSVAFVPYDANVESEIDSTWIDDQVRPTLESSGARWRVVTAEGEPSAALCSIADREEVGSIVVGTREPGFRAGLQEFFTGSIAAHLAHRQRQPVIVVPLSPVRRTEELPWSDGEAGRP
ncbi:universal stress protein [Labedella endophytica]|nr:universal stress protein [Labedella endophytica]